MPFEHRIRRRVEFSETDMAGIMHYSNYFKFMETAEHDFFRSFGFSIVTRQVEPPVGWPRVHAWCDFHAPLHFEDEVEVRLLVAKKRSKSIDYLFRFSSLGGPEPVETARGGLTVVCVRRASNGAMKAASIPDSIAVHIEPAPGELLFDRRVH
ncbi:MAG: acyl-CoA thioesterase [Verrucomicrobia bacterium]|nr:acyl-CoA thioesterase [Verrucomicrobiota bacterium]